MFAAPAAVVVVVVATMVVGVTVALALEVGMLEADRVVAMGTEGSGDDAVCKVGIADKENVSAAAAAAAFDLEYADLERVDETLKLLIEMGDGEIFLAKLR